MFRFALRFLIYDKPKSIGVILGIIISTFLIGQQTGIFIFLTDAMSSLIDNTQADIWVVDNRATDISSLSQIDIRIGNQVQSIPGVKRAYPLIIAGGTARFREGKSAQVTLIGSQPSYFKGGPYRIKEGQLSDLLQGGAVGTDMFDAENLNNIKVGDSFEINGKRVHLVLQTKGARGFGSTYVFSTVSRVRSLGKIPVTKASVFLVDIELGVETAEVCERINTHIPGIRAWTKDEFSRSTVMTILSSSGIAFSIGTLIIFASVAGLVIIGLTMYSAAMERLRDYGTLKAIGANNHYIRNLILYQAFFFGLTGYGIGILLLEGFRSGVAKSGVLFNYSTPLKIVFFLITLAISFGGAAFAMRRIRKLEPASVFRS